MQKKPNYCIFLSSKTCEFLHDESFSDENKEVKEIGASIVAIKASAMAVEEKMVALEKVSIETQGRISEIEKFVSKKNQIQSKVISLENENSKF